MSGWCRSESVRLVSSASVRLVSADSGPAKSGGLRSEVAIQDDGIEKSEGRFA